MDLAAIELIAKKPMVPGRIDSAIPIAARR